MAAGREQAPAELDGAEAGAPRLAAHGARRPRRAQAGLGRHARSGRRRTHPHPGVDPAHAVDEHHDVGQAPRRAAAAAAPTRSGATSTPRFTSAVDSASASPSTGLPYDGSHASTTTPHHATTRSTVAVRGPLRTT